MIEAVNLTKRYGDKLAVDGLTFTVRPGIVTGFLGPNGAGKSTTMRMILGLDAPTAGTVTVNGKPFAEHARPLQRGRRAARGTGDPHRPLGAQPPAGRWPPPPASAGRRVEEVIDLVGLRRGGRQARRGVLPRHGPAAGHRLGAARRPADADPRRTGQRSRPRRRALDPHPAARPRRRGPHRLPVLAPDERDGADRRPRHRRRAGPAAARPVDGRVHRRGLRRRRAGPLAAAAGWPGCSADRGAHGRSRRRRRRLEVAGADQRRDRHRSPRAAGIIALRAQRRRPPRWRRPTWRSPRTPSTSGPPTAGRATPTEAAA